MAQGHRVERVASLIRNEISNLLRKGIRDHRLQNTMVTITEVKVSGDLQHCKVFISVYGSDDEKAMVISSLNASCGFFRSEIGRNLSLRRSPEIIFNLDRGLEKGTSLLNLLDRLEKERSNNKHSSFDSSSDNSNSF